MQQQETVQAQVYPEVLALTATSNPYLDLYNAYCAEHEGELITVFDPRIKEKKRAKMFGSLDVSAAMKYSWAIPDERALQIIKHYGPIVEMGAGTGYWGKLLKLRGVDIICYDLHVEGEDEEESAANEQGESSSAAERTAETRDGEEDGDEEDGGEEEGGEESAADDDENKVSQEEEQEQDGNGEEDESEGDDDYAEEDEDEEVEVEQIYWTDVLKGTPRDLRKHSDRALFLCYPDDFEDSAASMALECLCNHSGDTVIHVGELFGQSVCLPGPWGRTSAKEFQEHLASVYHKVLQVPLPSWHTSIDTLTVWKRTQTSILGNAFYAFIPAEERLDLVEACDSTRHLLQLGQTTDEENEQKAASAATEEKKNGRSKRQKRAR